MKTHSIWSDAMRCMFTNRSIWSYSVLLCTKKNSRFTNQSKFSDAMRCILVKPIYKENILPSIHKTPFSPWVAIVIDEHDVAAIVTVNPVPAGSFVGLSSLSSDSSPALIHVFMPSLLRRGRKCDVFSSQRCFDPKQATKTI